MSKNLRKSKSKKNIGSRGNMYYQWKVLENKGKSLSRNSRSMSNNSEIKKMKSDARKQGEKILSDLMKKYVDDNRTWEEFKCDFRPVGSMNPWSVKEAVRLNMKTNSNYNPNINC